MDHRELFSAAVKASETPIEKTTKDIHKPSFKWSIGY